MKIIIVIAPNVGVPQTSKALSSGSDEIHASASIGATLGFLGRRKAGLYLGQYFPYEQVYG